MKAGESLYSHLLYRIIINFSVFKIIFPVMVTDLTQNPAGVPYRNYICRYIFCHNTSRSDNCVISYCNSRKDHCPRPDPAPLSYVYRHIVLIHFFS